jgi:glycosyltransferase involved in cell wall biosynthesis
MRRKKVLIISYYFPPVGGSGVQRVLKFVKYLPEFGWDPIVLTVKDINYSIRDYSLLDDIDPEIKIVRTESVDPHRLSSFLFSGVPGDGSESKVIKNQRFAEGSIGLRVFRWVRDLIAVPDTAVGWIPFAYRAGLRAIREGGVDVILATFSPSSSTLLAWLLSKKTGVPYVLDFRDPWIGVFAGQKFPTRLHKAVNIWLEGKVVKSASALTVYGDILARAFKERYPGFAGPIAELTNGFDPKDMDGVVAEERPEGRFRIVYMGSLYAFQEGNFRTLLSAMQLLPDRLRNSLEVVFVGRPLLHAPAEVATAGLEEQITFLPYKPHVEALGYLKSADAGLLFVPKGDRTIVTGKVFEYLMVGCPILACIEPSGACAEILQRAGCADWIVPADDAQALARTIVSLAAAGWPRPSSPIVEQFSRRAITERLAGVLSHVNNARG